MPSYLTLLAATLATASAQMSSSSMPQGTGCSGPSCGTGAASMMSNGMGGMMNWGSSMMGCMVTKWMTSSGNWQMANTAYSYSSNMSPKTIQVTVGGSAGLVYSPNTVSANVGDIIQFNFQSKNHTVTQSGFTTPCSASTGGMDSGFMPNPMDSMPNPAFQMQVTASTPLWFYCQQKAPESHCASGMVFSVNPTATKSMGQFVQMAQASNSTSSSSSMSSMVAPPPPSSSVVQGSASMGSNGQCQCQCLCGSNAYAPGYGLGMMGGMSGMIPSGMSSGMSSPPPMMDSASSAMAPPMAAATTMMMSAPEASSSYSGSGSGSSYNSPPPMMDSSNSGSSYGSPPPMMDSSSGGSSYSGSSQPMMNSGSSGYSGSSGSSCPQGQSC